MDIESDAEAVRRALFELEWAMPDRTIDMSRTELADASEYATDRLHVVLSDRTRDRLMKLKETLKAETGVGNNAHVVRCALIALSEKASEYESKRPIVGR